MCVCMFALLVTFWLDSCWAIVETRVGNSICAQLIVKVCYFRQYPASFPFFSQPTLSNLHIFNSTITYSKPHFFNHLVFISILLFNFSPSINPTYLLFPFWFCNGINVFELTTSISYTGRADIPCLYTCIYYQ